MWQSHKNCKYLRNTLEDVADTINKMVEEDNFAEEYVFDQTAFHSMVFNRKLHRSVLSERCPSPDIAETTKL